MFRRLTLPAVRTPPASAAQGSLPGEGGESQKSAPGWPDARLSFGQWTGWLSRLADQAPVTTGSSGRPPHSVHDPS